MIKTKWYFNYLGLWSFLILLISIGASYTVKDGDTLWDISSEFLQDPFKWNDIWSLNPDINDPNLIYPGHNINLVVNENESKPLAKKSQSDNGVKQILKKRNTLDFDSKMQGFPNYQRDTEYNRLNSRETRTNVSSNPKQLNQEIITRGPFFKRPIEKKKFFKNQLEIQFKETSGEILTIMDEFEIHEGEAEGIKLNSLYQVYSIGKKYKTFASKEVLGNSIEIKGIAKVIRIYPAKSVLVLKKCFGKITRDEKLSPYHPQAPLTVNGYKTHKNNAVKAQIVYISNKQISIRPYSYIIVDGGATVGFRIGDGVVLFDRIKKLNLPAKQALGSGIVVRNKANFATILIRSVLPGPLNKGDFVIAKYSAELKS